MVAHFRTLVGAALCLLASASARASAFPHRPTLFRVVIDQDNLAIAGRGTGRITGTVRAHIAGKELILTGIVPEDAKVHGRVHGSDTPQAGTLALNIVSHRVEGAVHTVTTDTDARGEGGPFRGPSLELLDRSPEGSMRTHWKQTFVFAEGGQTHRGTGTIVSFPALVHADPRLEAMMQQLARAQLSRNVTVSTRALPDESL